MRRSILDRLLEARRANRPAALVRNLGTGDATLLLGREETDGPPLAPELREAVARAYARDRSASVETPDGTVFIQVFNPPLRLIVVGAVHIAQPLAPMAALAGYDVTVVDPRRAFASDERFPGIRVSREWPDEALEELRPDPRTAIVTLTHDPKLDDPALDVALRSEAFYVAALGSKRTHAQRLERLKAMGHDAAALARIHGPAGLSLGAVSPAEIAVSIMAQMIQTLHQGGGGASE